MNSSREKWDNIYSHKEDTIPPASQVLSQYSHLLPPQGRALDLACGQGGNAFYLANNGFNVDAWDISSVVIEQMKKKVGDLTISPLAIDIEEACWPLERYNVITVSRFLNRQIIANLINALKPQGVIFYQTFTEYKLDDIGPSTSRFLLKRAELLSLFSALTPLAYHDEGRTGNTDHGIRNEALLVAQKR